MSKTNRMYKIFMTVMVAIIAGLLLACGVIAIQKSMKVKLSFEANPNFQIEVRILKEGETGEGTLIFKNFGTISIHEDISSLNGITLNASDDFISTYGSEFTLIIKNFTENTPIDVEISSTAKTITGAQGVPAEITPIKSEAMGYAENTEADYVSFVISVSAVFEQKTEININVIDWSPKILFDLTNCDADVVNGTKLEKTGEITVNFTPHEDCLLPASIVVENLQSDNYEWDSENGVLKILDVSKITKSVSVEVNCLALPYWTGGASTSFTGSGTSSNPYLIYNGEDLALLANKVNSGTSYSEKYFKVMNDIYLNRDFKNYETWETTAPANTWTPIGGGVNGTSRSFQGTFDGNNKTIYGLYFNNSEVSYVGLFGYCTHNASLKNITLSNSFIYGKSIIGGILGMCATNNDDATCVISYCGNKSVLKSMSGSVGGICGYAYLRDGDEGSIKFNYCFNNGNISSGGSYVSGILGNGSRLDGVGMIRLNCCYNTGSINGDNYVTAIVSDGGNYGAIYSSNVYNLGVITFAGAYGGGISSGISGCQNAYNVGKLVGANPYGISASSAYWSNDIGIYYLDDCGAIAGFAEGDTIDRARTAAELKTQSTYEGWDFDTVWAIDPNGVINDGYPYLRDLPPVA